MNALKRNLFMILCGVGGAAGIALAWSGLRAMPKVQEEMKKAEGVFRSLDGVQSSPVNQQRLDAERERIESILADYKAVVDKSRTLYRVDQLVEGALPDGPPVARNEFRVSYNAAMSALMDSLRWGYPASAAEVELMRRRIADEEESRRQFAINPNTAGLRPPDISGPPETPAGVRTPAGVLTDPVARAAVNAAQRVLMYATGLRDEKPLEQKIASLEFEPIMADTATVDPPFPDEVWRAQLGYWIQRDVVETIVALNSDAAKRASDAGQEPWVGLMPIKDLISVRIARGFIKPSEDRYVGHSPTGEGAALPAGTPVTVFTKSASGPACEVVQFTLKMVVDQRYLTTFLERFCNHRFYTPLRVGFVAVQPNRSLHGKVYGSDPAVIVVMDFEFVMLGQVFRKLMPKTLREAEEIKCRPVDECPEG